MDPWRGDCAVELKRLHPPLRTILWAISNCPTTTPFFFNGKGHIYIYIYIHVYTDIVLGRNKKTKLNLGDCICTRVHHKLLLPELNVQKDVQRQ